MGFSSEIKEDLERVQADYGKPSKTLPLTAENVRLILAEVTAIIDTVAKKTIIK